MPYQVYQDKKMECMTRTPCMKWQKIFRCCLRVRNGHPTHQTLYMTVHEPAATNVGDIHSCMHPSRQHACVHACCLSYIQSQKYTICFPFSTLTEKTLQPLRFLLRLSLAVRETLIKWLFQQRKYGFRAKLWDARSLSFCLFRLDL